MENATLVVTMKHHCATEDEARACVDPFLRAWEINSGLDRNRPAMTFDFAHSRIIDRSPSQGGLLEPLKLYGRAKLTGKLSVVVSCREYPAPPSGFAASTDVQMMWMRYSMYLGGREPLLSMAYFCLSLLEGSTGLATGARKGVCKKYGMDEAVREKLGDLISERGGPDEARKLNAKATGVPLTGEERQWVEDVINALIRRKAEYDADPAATRSQMTLADFRKI